MDERICQAKAACQKKGVDPLITEPCEPLRLGIENIVSYVKGHYQDD